tara:strand:+ start:971 stop:1300 length:330 start_codon:yes stop_codon:yes gene_type:complete
MSSKETVKKQLIKEMALYDLKQANMLKGVENMGKVKEYYQNELLLEREDEIKALNKSNRKLNEYVANLRYALLKVRAYLIALESEDLDDIKLKRIHSSLETIKEVLSNG